MSRPDTADDLQRAAALSGGTRRKVYEILRADDTPVRVADLASRTGVHRTVVRRHLEALADVGLVVRESLPARGRGRPSAGWRAVAAPVDAYRHLSTMLADAIRAERSPREQGRVAGREFAASGADGGVAAIVVHAERLGFDPELVADVGGHCVDVVLRRCPYLDVAELDPAVVCELHRGVAEGIAEVYGDVVVADLRPRPPHVAGCVVSLRVGPVGATAPDQRM